MKFIARGVILGCFMFGSAVSAETLPIEYVEPARADGVAFVRSLTVENLDDDAGGYMRNALIEGLRSASYGGEPWFAVLPQTYSDDTEAALEGAVNVVIDDRRASPKTKKSCAERDAKGKCIREEKREIACNDLVIDVDPMLRLVSREGIEVYRSPHGRQKSTRYCEDGYQPAIDPIVDTMIDEIVAEIVADLAPRQFAEGLRILESRKGLPKADANRFKQAIRLTKTDPGAACLEFVSLAEAHPGHGPAVFNAGLCYEMRGDTDTARDWYERAASLPMAGDYSRQGLSRLDANRRAADQIEEHFAAG